MSKLTLNSEPSERKRGLRFAEKFASQSLVELNGGVVTGSPDFSTVGQVGNDGLNGNYIDYYIPELKNDIGDITFIIPAIVNSGASGNPYLVSGSGAVRGFEIYFNSSARWVVQFFNSSGTLRTTVLGSGYTSYDTETEISVVFTNGVGKIFINGVDTTSTVGTAGDKIRAIDGDFRVLNYNANTLGWDGYVCGVKIFPNVALTDQEISDYANNTVWDYRNQSSLMLIGTSENDTTTQWLDVSGNENHATKGDGSTPSTYPTKLSKLGYSFDGASSQYLKTVNNAGSSITGNNPFTRSVLFSATSLNTGTYGRGLVCWGVNGEYNGNFVYYDYGTQGEIFAGFYASDVRFGDVGANATHHLVDTYDGNGTQIFYLNGVEAYRRTGLSLTVNPNYPIQIGRDSFSQSLYFDGNIGMVAIWDKALTQTQVIDFHLWAMRQVNKT